MKIIPTLFILILTMSSIGYSQIFGAEVVNQSQPSNEVKIESMNEGITEETKVSDEIIHTDDNIIQKTSQMLIKEPMMWNIGIFAIIASAITFIGILLTIRFVHIDKVHSDNIKKTRDDRELAINNQERLMDTEQFTKDSIRWFSEYIAAFYITIEQYERYRKENSHYGIRIDIISMIMLFTIGVFATTGFFEDMFIVLIVIVGVTVFFPIIHFAIQLEHLRTKFIFSPS